MVTHYDVRKGMYPRKGKENHAIRWAEMYLYKSKVK